MAITTIWHTEVKEGAVFLEDPYSEWLWEEIEISITYKIFIKKYVVNVFQLPSRQIFRTSGFWPRVRARALRAPVFLGSLPCQRGRCAPPPAHRSFAASYSTPKNIYNLSNLGRLRQGLFSFHKGYEKWDPLPPPRPSQLRWSFRQYFWGQIMFFIF